MKLNEKFDISPEFEGLFNLEKKDELSNEAALLAARFIREINSICEERDIKKKDFAKLLNTSASYITQVFSGDKMPNILFLAKAQDALNVVFDIKAKDAKEYYNHTQKATFKGKIVSINNEIIESKNFSINAFPSMDTKQPTSNFKKFA